MILVTVGTERFPFDRLARTADRLATELAAGSVFVQLGCSTYRPAHCAWADIVPFGDLRQQIDAASVVVTHAGVGLTLMCLRAGKVPIVLPRRREFGEHVDDHQVELAERLAAAGHVLLADDDDQVVSQARRLLAGDAVGGRVPRGESPGGLAGALAGDIASSLLRAGSRA